MVEKDRLEKKMDMCMGLWLDLEMGTGLLRNSEDDIFDKRWVGWMMLKQST